VPGWSGFGDCRGLIQPSEVLLRYILCKNKNNESHVKPP